MDDGFNFGGALEVTDVNIHGLKRGLYRLQDRNRGKSRRIVSYAVDVIMIPREFVEDRVVTAALEKAMKDVAEIGVMILEALG